MVQWIAIAKAYGSQVALSALVLVIAMMRKRTTIWARRCRLTATATGWILPGAGRTLALAHPLLCCLRAWLAHAQGWAQGLYTWGSLMLASTEQDRRRSRLAGARQPGWTPGSR